MSSHTSDRELSGKRGACQKLTNVCYAYVRTRVKHVELRNVEAQPLTSQVNKSISVIYGAQKWDAQRLSNSTVERKLKAPKAWQTIDHDANVRLSPIEESHIRARDYGFTAHVNDKCGVFWGLALNNTAALSAQHFHDTFKIDITFSERHECGLQH